MNDNTKNALFILAIPTIVVSAIMFTIPFALINAWVMQKMYIWFLIPLGTPSLNLWHVWGIILIANLLLSRSDYDSKEKWQKSLGKALGSVLGSFLILLIGYLIKGHIR